MPTEKEVLSLWSDKKTLLIKFTTTSFISFVGIRGVGFVSSPLIKSPRRTAENPIHITDWMPTFIHLAGGNTSNLQIDGVNQWHSISKNNASSRTVR